MSLVLPAAKSHEISDLSESEAPSKRSKGGSPIGTSIVDLQVKRQRLIHAKNEIAFLYQ